MVSPIRFARFFTLSFVLLAVHLTSFGDTPKRTELKLWPVAPPAPVFTDAERQTEFARRRSEVMKRLGDKGMLILFSAEPRLYTNDVDYPYRQENNLYYLTGLNQTGVTLVLIPSGKTIREIVFVPKRDPRNETWNGRMLSPEDATRISGIQEVWDSEQFTNFVAFLAPRAGWALGSGATVQRGRGAAPANDPANKKWTDEFSAFREFVNKEEAQLFMLLPQIGGESKEFAQEQKFAAKLPPGATGLNLKSAMRIFGELRQIKSPLEIKLMQHAVDISIEAFHRAFAVATPGLHEYEVQAEFEYTYRRRNAIGWGYPCIVGGGANATTLHYITNQDALAHNSVLLMDCAAEFDHYTADITRSIPVNGKFTKEQAEIYRIVYDAQVESIKLVKAGGTKDAAQKKATEVIKDGLLKLGLITSKETNEYRTWFMHGTSHWLGMNVHDVGTTDVLAPGMILTVEPGIYLRPDALDVLPKTPENEKFINAVRPVFEKYKGIGVRIEDDILVTDGEPRIMSDALPRKLEDVEAFIARLKQASKAGLP
ncbi:MAG TPA: aminopeptidase P family protein [Blastocatellia bacterium]|nr:aminopeptidase P family protein [Blastocatellia bacterium]